MTYWHFHIVSDLHDDILLCFHWIWLIVLRSHQDSWITESWFVAPTDSFRCSWMCLVLIFVFYIDWRTKKYIYQKLLRWCLAVELWGYLILFAKAPLRLPTSESLLSINWCPLTGDRWLNRMIFCPLSLLLFYLDPFYMLREDKSIKVKEILWYIWDFDFWERISTWLSRWVWPQEA